MEELKYLETSEEIYDLTCLICDLMEINEKYDRFGIDDLVMTYIDILEDLVIKIENDDIREKAIEIMHEATYEIINKYIKKIILKK